MMAVFFKPHPLDLKYGDYCYCSDFPGEICRYLGHNYRHDTKGEVWISLHNGRHEKVDPASLSLTKS